MDLRGEKIGRLPENPPLVFREMGEFEGDVPLFMEEEVEPYSWSLLVRGRGPEPLRPQKAPLPTTHGKEKR